MTKSKQKQFLIGLGVVWVLVLLTQVSDDSDQTVPPRTSQFGGASSQISATSSSPNPLELADVLEHPRQSVTLAKPRNIFNPLNLKKPISSGQIAIAPKTPVPVTPKVKEPPPPPIRQGPSPEELAAQRARQQLNQYRFLGYLKKGGESQAFLTNGQAIYIVKQGETVEGRIHINKIDPTNIILSTKIRETGGHVEATIPLTKKQQG